MKELVLKVFWGGLGDHLLYSPIPRLAKRVHEYDKVWISNHSTYRNPETKKLVWERNPFVDGFTDKDSDYPKFAEVPNGFNILDRIAMFYGLSDDGLRFREPEIYYSPKQIDALKDTVIWDPNSINQTGKPSKQQVDRYFTRDKITITHQMRILREDALVLKDICALSADLERLCDIIKSCHRFFCLTTGVATLAAALGVSATVLFVPGIKSMFHHSKLHTYVDISRGGRC
jgi:hypothetical protein